MRRLRDNPSHWDFHPKIRKNPDLTAGERAADRMRNGFGSWTAVFSVLGFIGLWIFLVLFLDVSIDNHQLTILNLVLSTIAALQGAIILLAAKRADKIASELAEHTYENGIKMLNLSQEILNINKQQLSILNELASIRKAIEAMDDSPDAVPKIDKQTK